MLNQPTSYQNRQLPPISAPRLLADGMLGTLAKWLRLLGYDTTYDTFLDDHALARLARAEGRLLLTRDRELAARPGLHTLFIESDSLEDQVGQVVAAVGPVPGGSPVRCTVCNGILREVSKNDIREHVPPHVYRNQSQFHRCDGCGRIYWRGTHWQRIERMKQRWLDEMDHARLGTKTNG